MYADFYGLHELPFNITPDPRFLYLNDCYQEALAALAYGIDARKGFISLIGEAGTGKTTLLRRLLDTLDPRTKTVLLLNPTVSFDEILEHILIELGIPTEGGGKLVQLQRLNEFLLEHTSAGGNVVLLIDEAQDLRIGALEELRLLSNLETAREKILQIVLAGQPELEVILRDPTIRQLRQRVTLNVRVRPLTAAEVSAYARTRLEHAGAADLDVLTPAALTRVATLSRGIPRLVNVLCDASLLMGFVTGTRPVTPAIVDAAWKDYSLDPDPPAGPPGGESAAIAPPTVEAAAPATAPAVAATSTPATTSTPETSSTPDAPPAPTDAPPAESPSTAASETVAAPAALPVETTPPPAAPESEATVPPVTLEAVPEPPAEVAVPESTPEDVPPATAQAPTASVEPPPASSAPPAQADAVAPGRSPSARRSAVTGPAPTEARPSFSIPAAAALLGALTVGIYALSIQDAAIERLAPVASSQQAADDSAPLEAGTAVAATAPPAVAVPPPAPAPAPQIEVIRADGTPVSAAEAMDLIDAFRAAYETRDVGRLVGLFAADAVENGRRGLDAITASYRTTLGNLTDVHYTLPSLSIAAGPHAAVRAPFVISYRQANGSPGEVKGDAEWELERRNGQVRIVGLTYRLGSEG